MNVRLETLVLPPKARLRDPSRARSNAPLGQILVDIGELDVGDMLRAVAMRRREDARLGDILLANNMITEAGLYRGLAMQFNCGVADLTAQPPDTRLIDMVGVETCLRHGFAPWRRIGARCVIATSRPESFEEARRALPAELGEPMMALAPASGIYAALVRARRAQLVNRAETRVALQDSCRSWSARAAARIILSAFVLFVTCMILAPATTFQALCALAFVALCLNTGLKLTAALATLSVFRRRELLFRSTRAAPDRSELPTISLLVPLFREASIAPSLIRRLSRLNYPRDLLDICLVVEADDLRIRKLLRITKLPGYMRTVTVPGGGLKTKPRALNFALDFCRGSIIGIYDAEDAPDPDQLHKVAARFHQLGPETACLQGILDFYNARTNWLSRCFSVEYASWFRVILPGLERLGLVVPLGGTTVFLRREALEEIGGWDSHNVTEDADLGVRLARRGYRTELIRTVTEEEANCRAWPWVRQRSRWLKGYMITWAVHMRRPLRLLRDLGLWRFLGFQVLFVGTILQFLLAPVLWTFWALPLGLHHPFASALTQFQLYAMTGAFLVAEFVTLGVSVYATAGPRHRWLWKWVPTLHLYFPLATVACLKGLWELAARPFYWDKTEHGVSTRGQVDVAHKAPIRARAATPPFPRPVSGGFRKPG